MTHDSRSGRHLDLASRPVDGLYPEELIHLHGRNLHSNIVSCGCTAIAATFAGADSIEQVTYRRDVGMPPVVQAWLLGGMLADVH